ncbi:MAG: hypothetical protein AVDCRST_MAG40-2939, partial [uncultured Gemmatimonadaceae bacterium]
MVVTGTLNDGFIRDDLRIIHQFAAAVTHELARTPAPGGRVLGRVTRVALNVALFLRKMWRNDVRVVVFWFAVANYAPVLAWLAKRLGARVVVITGGQDAVYVPEIDWGDMKRPRHRRGFNRLMKLADAVLPFSDSARAIIAERDDPRRIRTAYPSIDTRFFAPAGAARARRIVTCCYQYGAVTIVQKGLDQLVAAARLLPDEEFVIVGDPVDERGREFAASAPPNVRFLPRIPSRAAYREFLAGSSVYAQLSAHEGFGVSAAEAM